MTVDRKNIVSLFIGFFLLGLLFNPIEEIPDVPHQSFLFTCTFLATVIGIAAFYPTKQFINRLTIIDLLVILIAVGSIYFYPPNSNLLGLARFALIILYWSIRQTGECRFSISFQWGILTVITIALLSCLLYQFKPASADGRILIWKITAQMIKEKPFTGFDPNGFTANYMHFQSEYLKKEGSIYEKQLADNNHYVYNEPLRWTVEYGVAGLLLYIGILYCIFSYKKREIQSLSAQAIYIAGLAWGLFSYPDQTFPILAVMTIALAEMSNKQRECVIKQLPHKYIFPKAVIFLAIAGQ